MKVTERVKILDHLEISPGVYYIQLKKLQDFIPGQLLALSDKARGESRYYSLASGRSDDFWGILYNRVDDGWLTPWLSGLKKGDALYTSMPFGEFLPVDQPMIWIGTGTGIAPYHAMIRSGFESNSVLIHGARGKQDFYFHDHFKETMGDRYIPCSSTGEEGFYQGRLSEYLKREFAFPAHKYYLCGSSPMVVTIRDLLLANGVKFNDIISEIYF